MRQLSFESGPPAQTDSYQTHVDGRTHFSGSPTASEELVLKTGIVTLPSEANEDEQRRKRHRRIGAAALLIFCLVTGAIILGVVLGARNNTLSHATDGLPAGDSPRKAAKGEKLWGVGGDTMTVGLKLTVSKTLIILKLIISSIHLYRQTLAISLSITIHWVGLGYRSLSMTRPGLKVISLRSLRDGIILSIESLVSI